MKTMTIEVQERGAIQKSAVQELHSDKVEEFLEVMVLLCNKLDVDVPLWTYKNEKTLQKKNEVSMTIDSELDMHLRIHIE